ncbi:hypothetical protein NO976_02793 [Planktothrix agardhii]|uniref:Uncharacterized protein n=1 Tax=Planktothrix agardhii TaxID=1160 RepID=A0AAD1Q517_PLAAG|nr:hypothetical protein [Planktothrix agardhii]MCF3580799.1 hypothetical protein [Planktothrix agardhii 1811]CAD5950853.1 hypothetical protein NIVACYA_02990 [Planktothrix agardhii]CAD5953712.1 hypothetical protein NO976_02793 [Planktothrix agardhii]CAD5964917.1 hypothetical protein PANO66_03549 [Planktothrix agardhii]CAD5969486.1 hypothetical protein NO2A_04175 [Planktothrix agardhii]
MVEVVCGILFQDLQLLLTPHIGLLWQKFQHEYPEFEELPPLAPAIEFFDESPDINVVFSEIPPTPRIWFIETNGNKDDGDYVTVPTIRVFTANNNVISAARHQGKLVTR